MSHKAMDWATAQRPPKSADKMVLIGLANHVDRGGDTCFPSVAALADFTLLKRQTIIDCLATLAEIGLIEDTGQRVGRTRQVKVWKLRLDR